MRGQRLARELDLLGVLLGDRVSAHLEAGPQRAIRLEDYGFDVALFADHVHGEEPTIAEHVLMVLALTPHLRPDLLVRVVGEHLPEGSDLPEFGGVRVDRHRGVLPTGETAQFLVAGTDLTARIDVQRILAEDAWMTRRHVLWVDDVAEGEPRMSGRLVLDPEIVQRVTTGSVTLPRFSSDFPAEHIGTEMDWDDVVLREETRVQVAEIEQWIRVNDTIMEDWGMRKRVRPGFRVLFHGPSGTGKTLTATLIGKSTGRPVFRIDLSRVVSKYIGETEKNLSRLFSRAENKDWILFFDEADALFGKRTDIRDAHDKYANQEVAYLLQRIETYAGVVILATNQRNNLDDAFLRRFQSAVYFPPPGVQERVALWEVAFPGQLPVAGDVDWREIASRYELSAAAIVNVSHRCALHALGNGWAEVDRATIESAVMREYVKDGKIV